MKQKGSNLKKIDKYYLGLSRKPIMRIFDYHKHRKSRDILSIAFGIFELEKKLKASQLKRYYIERFIKNNKNKLENILSDFISYMLLKSVEISFFNSKAKYIIRKKQYEASARAKALVLFSGGIDSFCGIFWANKYFNNNIKGIFCAHIDQAWNIHIVNSLITNILRPANIKLNTIYVPPIRKGGYSQLRGILYLLAAGAWMQLLGSKYLVVSECGPTMYQPRFGPFDMVTMTTHPFVIETAKTVLEVLLDKNVNVITPFSNMTKAEMIAFTPFNGRLKDTYSCVSQRFGKHDGTCYGCVIRRLAAITAGVDDVNYLNDPIMNNRANSKNLISLLKFSLDILTDYNNMPLFEIENIEAYNKLDLFKRFALDNFAAIHLLVESGFPVISDVQKLYGECLNRIGENKINERINRVRKKDFRVKITSA